MWRLLFLLSISLHAEVSALYLSWYGDPTTTMTIQWHTPQEEFGDTIHLLDANEEWVPIEGTHSFLEQILIHQVSLENLQPNTDYSFVVGSDPTIYRFRTAPDTLEHPLRFVVGGDLYASRKRFRKMSQTVLQNDPHFVVLGGDLAYAIGAYPFRSSELKKWIAFLKDWKEHMITADNRVIPFLIVPGNHDIASDQHEVFFKLFAFPQKQLYRSLDFGSYLSLLLLDTGHFQPIEGQQTLWLDKTLSARIAIPYRFAVYHESAYPSCYPYLGAIPKKIRTYWTPLFEKYNLLAAFENHNHAFKRTHPIKANQIDPTGVVYIGDGSWGTHPRKPNDQWYLAKKGRKNNILLIELNPQEATVWALDLLNKLIDTVSFKSSN